MIIIIVITVNNEDIALSTVGSTALCVDALMTLSDDDCDYVFDCGNSCDEVR
jgi:hypothetical protein